MPIELYGSSDRVGGNIVDMIAQLTYARKHFHVIHYNRDKLRVYNSYNQGYNGTIFMETLFDLIDAHNMLITDGNTTWIDLAAPSHFEVLSRTTLELESDMVSFFRDENSRLYTDEMRASFLEKGKVRNYDIPFDPEKTILVHLRMEDVKGRGDYDGSLCADYMRDRIEAGDIPGNEVLAPNSTPDPWGHMQGPLDAGKVQAQIDIALEKNPDHEVILITNPNEDTSALPYRVRYNPDECYDLFLLCNAKTLILSRSNFALTSLFFGMAEDAYVPLWGHVPCYGLYTKYDKTNINYFK